MKKLNPAVGGLKAATAAFILLSALFFFCSGALVYWIYSCRSFINNTVVSGYYLIEKGDSVKKVYGKLFEGLTPPAGILLYMNKLSGYNKTMHYGLYQAQDIPLSELITNVSLGRQILFKVTIPEGYNMYEVAAALENAGIASQKDMLEIFTDKDVIFRLTGERYESFEGFIPPETYFFCKNYSPYNVVKSFIDAFYSSLPENFENHVAAQGLTFYEGLILASIVQKETYDARESPVVAGVFLNRMKTGMPLQADPTIIYGIFEKFNGNITKADLQDRSNKFNTYRHRGLPPTPISNPSVTALNAVANPAVTGHYYFVATKDGKHVFAGTYDEHRKNVRIHQLGYSK